MANYTIDPNMGFANPTPGQDPGPDYATNQFNANTTIGAHDHSSGKGVPVTPNGLNINADLPINGNNVTSVKTVNFSAQSMSLPGSTPNLGCVYVAGNELYYNDEAGNVVAITNNGSVNAGAGSITGLPSGTASASYSAGPGTFIWQSATSTAANMDFASITIREQLASANGITISSPSSLAANYSLSLPSALPASRKLLTVDNSGNIGDVLDGDNVTIEQSGNVLQLKDGGITNVKINAAADIDGSKMLDGSISVAKLFSPMPTGNTVAVNGFAKGNFQASFTTTSNVYINASQAVIITTSGRPVFVGLRGDVVPNEGSLDASGNAYNYRIFNATTNIDVATGVMQGITKAFPSTVWGIDDSIIGSAGTYNYVFQIKSNGVSTIGITSIALVAYEI